jgi:probable HAF family extracellular repeat protein
LPAGFKGPGFAAAVNQDGLVAGQFTTDKNRSHACRWDSKRLQDLDQPGGLWSGARAINRRGTVVGEYSTGPDQAIRGFLWHDGTLRDLGTLGGADSHALGINDSGLIAGYARDRNGLTHAVVWENGRPRALGTHSAKFPRSQALALNDSGVVVGSAFNDRGGEALIWNGSRMERLEPPPRARSSVGTSINQEGDAAGNVIVEGDLHTHACFWRQGKPEILRGLGFASNATAVNTAGHVGGSYFHEKGEQRAFLWAGRTMHDLTSLLEGAGGLVLRSVLTIDDRGWIAGVGVHAGLPMAFVARPR